jgi:outer membrane autotransporter protein
MARRQANSEAREAAEVGFDLAANQSDGAARANSFDVWIEGTYASFGDRRLGSDLDGHFGLLRLGADYVVNPRLLLGAMVQFDSMSQHSDLEASDVEGEGWVVGPYATMRLTDNVFWRVRAAWGQSSNDVRPFLTYTDQFETERWLVSSQLTGNLEAGRWSFRPSASIFYMEDVAEAYTDGAGAAIPEIESRLGQIEAGPEISYRYQFDDMQLEPHAALRIAATFANEASASGFGQIDSNIVGPDGMRARAEFGLRATTRGGLSFDLTGNYDGIGSDRFESYGARVTLRVPLN